MAFRLRSRGLIIGWAEPPVISEGLWWRRAGRLADGLVVAGVGDDHDDRLELLEK